MKLKHLIILLVLIIASATVAGCICGAATSGPTAVPTGTPTDRPGEGSTPTVTPAPTQAAGGHGNLSKLGQMYYPDILKSYKYRVTSPVNGVPTTLNYEVAYSDETYQGTPARLTRISSDQSRNGTVMGQSIVDIHTSKGDGTVLGVHEKTIFNGVVTLDHDLPTSMASVLLENDIVTRRDNSGFEIKYAGTDNVTIGNIVCECTIYTPITSGSSDAADRWWYWSQAPMPVREESTRGNTTQITELVSWS